MGKHKGSVHTVAGYNVSEVEYRHSSTIALTSALEGGGAVSATPRPIYPREVNPVPTVQAAGWTPGKGSQ